MSKVGNAINKVRTKLDAKAEKFMADTCSLLWLSQVDDGRGGWTNTQLLIASNVPCSYAGLSNSDKQLAGKVLTDQGHNVTLPCNADTQIISPNHQLLVAARGVTPSLLFKSPIVLKNSLTPFVNVAAALSEEPAPVGPFDPLPDNTGIFQEEITIPISIPTEHILAHIPVVESISIYMNGNKQALDSYSVTGQTITLPIGLTEGDLLSFWYIGEE